MLLEQVYKGTNWKQNSWNNNRGCYNYNTRYSLSYLEKKAAQRDERVCRRSFKKISARI